MLKKTLLILIYFSISLSSCAQTLTDVEGQILNSETNAPIAFVNVYGHEKGTSSNQIGVFFLKFNSLPEDSLLTFSCIGFEAKKIPLSQILKNRIVFLNPKIDTLREVVVSSISPKEIAWRAGKKLQESFDGYLSSSQFTLDQFILDTAYNLLGHCSTYGIVQNKFIDSLNRYPKFQIDSIQVSDRFLNLDTVSRIGYSVFSTEAHSLSPYTLLSIEEPIRFLLLKNIKEEKFYQSIDFELQGIESTDLESHYVLSAIFKQPFSPLVVSALFKINTKDYGVKNAMIKIGLNKGKNGFEQRDYTSASYQRIKKKYYLVNLDVLNSKVVTIGNKISKTYYLSSLKFHDLRQKKHYKLTTALKKELEAHYLSKNKIKIVNDENVYYREALKRADFVRPLKY
jgi:hypothetical protein